MRTLNRRMMNRHYENKQAPKRRLRAIPEKDMNMMNCMERIVDVLSDEGLDKDSLKRVDRYVKYVAERQGVTPMQAVFMAFFVNEGEMGITSTADLSMEMSCPNIRIISHQVDIDALVDKRIIRKVNGHEMLKGYKLNKGVIRALTENMPYTPPSRKTDDVYQLFTYVFELTHARYEREIDSDELKLELNRLYDENSSLHYVKALRDMELSDGATLILSQMCRHLVTVNKIQVAIDSLAFLFDEYSERAKQMRDMQNGDHELMKKGLVDFSVNGGFKNRGEFVLTDKARKTLLAGIKFDYCDELHGQCANVIKSGRIEAKQLVFDETVTEQYGRLAELLEEDRLQEIRSRLGEINMRKGFAILFYGAPGTGKTETVRQIAKRTGRDIMQVNISEMRSMWVGESEKNIKAVFDNYRDMCKRSAMMPILLFNEADAILGTRLEGASQSVDKMENTVQNIILQEMEDFEGILIATTNLASNLDKAFERRFLYKIEFVKPDENARKALWQAMMPDLDDESALTLARRYDFSGGQIENVARKAAVDTILYGKEKVDLRQIESYCMGETIGKKPTGRIGFLS